MRSLPQKHILVSILVITALISIPVFLIDHFSISRENKLFAGVRQRKADTDFTKQSKRIHDKLILLKNSSLDVNKCRLIFKGIREGKLLLELYLLEMDSTYAYRYCISRANACRGFRLGPMTVEMMSAKRDVLKLKIVAQRGQVYD